MFHGWNFFITNSGRRASFDIGNPFWTFPGSHPRSTIPTFPATKDEINVASCVIHPKESAAALPANQAFSRGQFGLSHRACTSKSWPLCVTNSGLASLPQTFASCLCTALHHFASPSTPDDGDDANSRLAIALVRLKTVVSRFFRDLNEREDSHFYRLRQASPCGNDAA
jgi:hypothetical protein